MGPEADWQFRVGPFLLRWWRRNDADEIDPTIRLDFRRYRQRFHFGALISRRWRALRFEVEV
jgi:hypothetical protein